MKENPVDEADEEYDSDVPKIGGLHDYATISFKFMMNVAEKLAAIDPSIFKSSRV